MSLAVTLEMALLMLMARAMRLPTCSTTGSPMCSAAPALPASSPTCPGGP